MQLLNFKNPSTFGLNIDDQVVELVYISKKKSRKFVTAYGSNTFEPSAIAGGEIVNSNELLRCITELLDSKVVGKLDSNLAVLAAPIHHSYSKVFVIPEVSDKDIQETVTLEAEQYIPTKIDQLYIDYEVVARSNGKIEVLLVATPRKIIDSYVNLFDKLKVKIHSIETNMNAMMRLLDSHAKEPSPLLNIHVSHSSSSLTILDNTVRVTGRTPTGERQLLQAASIAPDRYSKDMKILYDLLSTSSNDEIFQNISPLVKKITSEAERVMNFYKRSHPDSKDIERIIVTGPAPKSLSLCEAIQADTKIATSLCDPWAKLHFNKIAPPGQSVSTDYAVAVGLALKSHESSHKPASKVIDTDTELTAEQEEVHDEEILTEEDPLSSRGILSEHNTADADRPHDLVPNLSDESTQNEYEAITATNVSKSKAQTPNRKLESYD